ncbi:xylosidase/arabinosidase, partial [Planoprotostelium fungivorum]
NLSQIITASCPLVFPCFSSHRVFFFFSLDVVDHYSCSSNSDGSGATDYLTYVQKPSTLVTPWLDKPTKMRVLLLLLLYVAIVSAAVNSKTIAGKTIYGYQAWFRCPGDGSGWPTYWHWTESSSQPPNNQTIRVDLFPDVSEYPSECLCPTQLSRADGTPLKLYSSFCTGVIDTHFKWMKKYNIDGVFVQRFFGYQNNPDTAQILQKVRAAAEKYGRVFAVEYDMSGAAGDQIQDFLTKDWEYLTNTLHITDSPAYLHHNNLPVLEIWGFFKERMTPQQATNALNYFKPKTFLIAGVNWIWRFEDVKNNDPYAQVYKIPHVIQPWMVGAFDEGGFQGSWPQLLKDDMDYARSIGVEYSPVLWPGFSWRNMHVNHNPPQDAKLNQVPRDGGKFIKAQAEVHIANKPLFLFLAMFDEVDEGTAQFKVVATRENAPVSPPFVTLDMDGYKMNKDAYLVIAGGITKKFHQVWGN